VKSLLPNAKTLVTITQPFGEYHAKSATGVPPMLYAEMLANAGIAFEAFGLEIELGVPSIGHFSRAFKASTGVPPHQWLMLERVAMAEGLLAKSSTPLVHVAGMCGFADQSHFCRVFTRFKGCSPGVWRREHWSQ